jgi:phosphonate transport system substrate-binding protein
MIKKVLTSLAMILTISFLAGCGPLQSGVVQATPTAKPALPADAQKIVIGVISPDAASTYRLYQPIADYMASKLGEYNIQVAEVKVASDIETMAQWIKTGEVNVAFGNLYATMRLRELGNAKAILRQWMDGDARTSSMIISSKTSGILTLDDLKGKIIALETSSSATGYLLPISILVEKGYTVREVANLQTIIPEDTIGYYFTGDDENTAQLVITGKVPAGAISSLFLNNRLPAAARDALTIINESDKITQQVVVVSPVLDEKIAASVQSILQNMETDPAGQELEKNFNNTSHFENIDTSIIFDPARQHYFLILSNSK